ncbi:hypothetical protein QRD02_08800 [Aequorivita sp. SDUM287046]|uniref:DUF2116 family Zn-ribbon domain-containing protein n=1 Tax=Aequorivita aurantiaca TaxID=3053356 RepID=A0ABT8DKP0_9FLAO|nr:hypothetical protein [Aequorivita aurantiaca]MDN3724480.1 hypothetical protein [Aequorivita aurantiaca]
MECHFCKKKIDGRSDKIFCDVYCKSSYHYKKSKESIPNFYKKVDSHLKLNRRLLKNYNKAGKSTIRTAELVEMGFNPNFFTHYWKNKKGDVYLFVYEFGFLRITENGKEKYVLIKWQKFMENKVSTSSN